MRHYAAEVVRGIGYLQRIFQPKVDLDRHRRQQARGQRTAMAAALDGGPDWITREIVHDPDDLSFRG